MIRKVFKKRAPNQKILAIINKYKVPKEYLSINRTMIANAMLIGLFVGMIPMPMQMFAVLMFVPFVKFNVPLGVSLVWLTNPLTMPIIFYAEYLLGNLILFRDGIEGIEMSVSWFENNIDAIFVPLYVGAFVSAVVLSVSARYLVIYLWKRSVHKEKHSKKMKVKYSN